MTEASNFDSRFSQQTSYFEDEELKNLTKFALRIQLAATGIATSFLLLFVPNVETITILSFLFGFLFPASYAITITLTMVIGWELLVTMILSFSGITFFFKILAWSLITLLGNGARKLKITKAYEFAFFGFLSALIFDFIVTISIPLVFINDEGGFTNVFIAALILGIPFTISHVFSNSILFSFFPKLTKAILPLLNTKFSDIVKIKRNHFENGSKYGLAMFIIFILMSSMIGYGTFQYLDDSDDENNLITVQLHISYNDILPDEHFTFETNTSRSVLEVTQTYATLKITYFFDLPYIEGINGITENEDLSNYSWIFYIDSIKSRVHAGTSLYRANVNNDSILLWNYELVG